MNKELVIVTSSGDWGDELNLEGFAIFTKEKWEKEKAAISDKPFEAYYGSNEFVTFESKEEYLSYLKERQISTQEIDLLNYILNLKIDVTTEFFDKYGFSYGLFV